MDGTISKIKVKLSGMFEFLNEKQRRLLAGAEALAFGYGGIKIVSEITGMDHKTIRRGINDLTAGAEKINRVRVAGGGRKKVIDHSPIVKKIIEELIEPDTRGDPESPLRWTCKSVRNISDFLHEQGYDISRQTIASILHEQKYSLQGNKKLWKEMTTPIGIVNFNI